MGATLYLRRLDNNRHPLDVTHVTLSVFFLTFLVVATFWVLSPFLTSLLWATIVCVAIWPILLRLEAFLGGRRYVAVAIMTAMILLVVFVPVTLALLTIVHSAQDITNEIHASQAIAIPPPPSWLRGFPFGGERMAAEWSRFAALDPQQRAATLAPYAYSALQWFAVRAGGVGTMLLQFLLTAIVSAIVLARGETVRDGILRFAARLGGRQGYDAAVLAGKTIRGVVLGVVVTAVVQATIGGTALFSTGVPAAALLTAVMLFLCLAQLGPLLVLIPAVIWLFWSDKNVAGTILLIIAVFDGALDNVIRPVLIRRGANLPLVLIFAGVIGGLLAFGIIGLFIGPVVLSVAYTLLTTWMSAPAEDLTADS
jgi:predicted PurR-regulated permease PerM